MYCPKCGLENDEDAFYCKKCGFPLDEELETYEPNSKTKVKKHTKTKTKNHTKTKVKYKDKNNKQKGKMSFFQKFMMFFFILLSIAALGTAGYLGYYIYQNQNIVVPSVLGYSYEKAEATLKENKLQAEKIEKLTTDETEVGIVIKQSKNGGSKASENTVIKLTVGVLDTKVTVPSVVNLSMEDAIKKLIKNNVKYKIIYETSDKDEGTVLKQSIKANTKIENTETITITISKKAEVKTNEEDIKDDDVQS